MQIKGGRICSLMSSSIRGIKNNTTHFKRLLSQWIGVLSCTMKTIKQRKKRCIGICIPFSTITQSKFIDPVNIKRHNVAILEVNKIVKYRMTLIKNCLSWGKEFGEEILKAHLLPENSPKILTQLIMRILDSAVLSGVKAGPLLPNKLKEGFLRRVLLAVQSTLTSAKWNYWAFPNQSLLQRETIFEIQELFTLRKRIELLAKCWILKVVRCQQNDFNNNNNDQLIYFSLSFDAFPWIFNGLFSSFLLSVFDFWYMASAKGALSENL